MLPGIERRRQLKKRRGVKTKLQREGHAIGAVSRGKAIDTGSSGTPGSEGGFEKMGLEGISPEDVNEDLGRTSFFSSQLSKNASRPAGATTEYEVPRAISGKSKLGGKKDPHRQERGARGCHFRKNGRASSD